MGPRSSVGESKEFSWWVQGVQLVGPRSSVGGSKEFSWWIQGVQLVGPRSSVGGYKDYLNNSSPQILLNDEVETIGNRKQCLYLSLVNSLVL